ncbi:MAG TPA: MFS transporter [Firmicutes bacterium]|nr:MFS transporter [Bacillota bacterium]
MATFTAAMDIGMGIGVMGLGYLLAATSITTLYLTCASILLACLLYVLFPWRSRLEKPGSKPGGSEAVEVWSGD